MVLAEILVLSVTIVGAFIAYFKWAFTYWEKKNVPTQQATIPFGTIGNPFTRKDTIGVYIKNMYLTMKSQGYKHIGNYTFSRPEYMPIDLDIIKNILQKDFHDFTERGFYYNEKDDPLSANLFALGGPKWKNLRTQLTPTFTSGKMKMMFDILVQCSQQMLEATDKLYETKEAVDIKDVLACYTTDVIGSCAFGLECNSFKNPDAEFRKYGKKIFSRIPLLHFAGLLLAFFKPKIARFLRVRFFPIDVTDFFMNVVKDTVNFRETNNVNRKDMLQLLIDLKNNPNHNVDGSKDTTGLTIEELAAQAFVFFVAGFETSSTTMTFCLYELAKNQDIQQKVRDEVTRVLSNHNEKLSYDSITEMKYLGQVVDETLRRYPPLPFITRQSVTDYNVPNMDLIIPKGMTTLIPILGIHHDPEYYPDPEKFDPERFTDEQKQQRQQFTYLPFGEGPRVCIGLRFGLMQTKVGLATLLRNYKFSLNEMTVDPLVMDRFVFILTSESGIFLNIERV